MAETTLQTKEEFGLVDTLNGLLAFAVKRVIEATGGEYQGFTDGELHNGIRALKVDLRFQDSHLKYLDFRRTGDCYYSSALEDIFFVGGAFGAHHYSISRGRYQITLETARCNSRIARFRKKFGEETVHLLEQMADELITQTPRYAQIAV